MPIPGPVPPEQTDFLRDLLLHFDRLGWPGAPRFEGVDADGRVLTSALDGHVASHFVQPPAVWSTPALIRVAKLVRQLHDLTAGTRLAGDHDVVCHNALAPRTTVYRRPDLVPYAFVDWEQAAPGRRIDDLAHACWQFLGIGPGRSSAFAVGGLLRQVSDAYGLTGRERGELIAAILDCVDDETAGWIEAERTGLEVGLG
ncbi:protein kinase family protein [Flindersiella endophytica]